MKHLTEREIVQRYLYCTVELESRLSAGEDFTSVADDLPVAAHVNHPETLAVLLTNTVHSDLTGHCIDEIRDMGDSYLNKYIHPKSMEDISRQVPRFYAHGDRHKSFLFVQYVYFEADHSFQPMITFTKPSLLPDGSVVCLTLFPQQFGSLTRKVEQVVEIDQFRLRNFRKFQSLSPREIELLKLLGTGLNNATIGEIFGISRQTVETHRKHLKRKLEIKSFQELMRFALAFGLLEL
ncbi:MAG: helix-turn-helix transcriptional regulator [Pseudohongiellaceae bacterium]